MVSDLTENSARIAYRDDIGRNVLRNNASCAYYGVVAYRNARKKAAETGRFFVWSGINVFECMHPVCGHENMLAGRRDFDNIIRPISAVSPDEKVSDLMERLRTMREHMLLVGSEDDALGIITREDMIEELLGDMDDKYDLTPVTSLPTPEPEPQEEEVDE